jgi:hypothetical protein
MAILANIGTGNQEAFQLLPEDCSAQAVLTNGYGPHDENRECMFGVESLSYRERWMI